MIKTLSELMTLLPQTVGKNAPLRKAIELMENTHCSHLPVLHGGKLCGIISDKDIRAFALNGEQMIVSDIMSIDPIVLTPDDTINTAIKLMLDNDINSVIVSASGEVPWGIFTATDALRFLATKL